MMTSLIFILHIIPSLIFVILGFYLPYVDLKKNSSLLDYFNNMELAFFVFAWCAFVTPVFNWLCVFLLSCDDIKLLRHSFFHRVMPYFGAIRGAIRKKFLSIIIK